jgi:type IV pilus assembly protein PilQ
MKKNAAPPCGAPRRKKPIRLVWAVVLFTLLAGHAYGQADARLTAIKANLQALEVETPGLSEKTELSVSGIPLDEFLRALAKNHKLNLNIAVGLQDAVTNNFSNVTVADILYFLAETYNLDYRITTNIIHISRYQPTVEPIVYAPKTLSITLDSATQRLTVNFKNDSLHLVAQQLSIITNENIVFAPALSGKRVSLYLQGATLYKTLEQLAFANQMNLEYAEDSTYRLLPPEESNAQKDKANPRKPGRVATEAVLFVQNPDSSYTLQAENQPIGAIIATMFGQTEKNLFYYAQPTGNLSVRAIDTSFDRLLNQAFSGTKYTFRKAGDTYYVGERSQEGMRATQRLHLQYRSIDKIKTYIPANLMQELQVVEFPELNSLVVSGSYPQIQELQAYFEEIDKPVPVIQIEVMIIDYNRNHDINVGMEMGIGDQPVKSGGTVSPGIDYTLGAQSINRIISGFNGFGSLNLGPVNRNFYIGLRALETNGVIKTRSTPRLATLNGHEATITIGKTEYYVLEQQSLQGVQNPIPIVTRSYQSVTADFTLKIKPFVSGEGQVTLEIEVQQSDFTGRIAPDAPPGQVTRTFTTIIRVGNEDMILIGGLEENETEDTTTGLPWFSRIPVIKWFFSKRNRRKSDNRLNIFVKPTIIS